jgi:hypothetical protein
VHARLGPQPAVGVLAFEADRAALDARDLTVVAVDDLGLESVLVAPAQVHAHEHLRPVLRLGATRASLDVEERVVRVHLAREHALELELADRAIEIAEVGLDRPRRARVALGLREVEQFAGLDETAAQPVERSDHGFEPGALAAKLLRALRVLPDGRVLELPQDLGQPLTLAFVVKGTPSAHRCAAGGLRSGGGSG